MRLRQWINFYIVIPITVIALIFSFNFIIDPYSMTSYNLLSIPNKFARDDRKEKVAKLYMEKPYNNILFGSSHVYSINPLTLTKYLGGRTYNAGVGTARIEDHLGFLLYLQRIKKLPKNVVIGLDFYSFNQNVETNKYFLHNEDLNFSNKKPKNDLYFSKFLSLDALRASYKTLRNFLKDSKDKPRFDINGATGNASTVFDYYPSKITQQAFAQEKVDRGYADVKTVEYTTISKERINYIRQIITLCKENSLNCTFFITPLSGQLLSRIEADKILSETLSQFKNELGSLTGYYDFLIHNLINDNRFFFGGDTMHTTTFTGNLILARIFHDHNISLPEKFGRFRVKESTHP